MKNKKYSKTLKKEYQNKKHQKENVRSVINKAVAEIPWKNKISNDVIIQKRKMLEVSLIKLLLKIK